MGKKKKGKPTGNEPASEPTAEKVVKLNQPSTSGRSGGGDAPGEPVPQQKQPKAAPPSVLGPLPQLSEGGDVGFVTKKGKQQKKQFQGQQEASGSAQTQQQQQQKKKGPQGQQQRQEHQEPKGAKDVPQSAWGQKPQQQRVIPGMAPPQQQQQGPQPQKSAWGQKQQQPRVVPGMAPPQQQGYPPGMQPSQQQQQPRFVPGMAPPQQQQPQRAVPGMPSPQSPQQQGYPPGMQPPQQHQRGPPGMPQQRGPQGPQQQRSPPGMQSPSQQQGMQPPRQQQQQRGPPQTQVSPQQQQRGPPQQSPQKSTVLKEQEDLAKIKQLELELLKLGIKEPPPNKLVSGKKGRQILVEANHLRLDLGKLKTAYHYDVKLTPDLPKKMLRPAMELFRKAKYPDRYPAFDGRKNLYSASELPFGDNTEGTVVLDEEGRNKSFHIELKLARVLDLSIINNTAETTANIQGVLQCIDIVLRSAPAASCIPVGRSFFTKPQQILNLGDGMEMYYGFYQSAIRGWKPFLNVDVAHKAFPKEINVIDAILELLDDRYRPVTVEQLSRGLNYEQTSKVNQFLRTLKVDCEVPGQPGSRRSYRINELGESAAKATFKLESGQESTVLDYYQKTKNYRIKFPHLQTLWVGSKLKRILLPAELCTIQRNQPLNRKMTENQTSAMIKFAATSTDIRKNKIFDALKMAQHNNHPSVKEFGFTVGSQFEKISARVLEPPLLQYLDGTKKPQKGIWRAETNKFLKPAVIKEWTICNTDRYPPKNLDQFADMVTKLASQSGMSFTAARQPFTNVRNSYPEIRNFFQTNAKRYELIFVVIPNAGPQYSFVKRAAELNVGCLTQCIKNKTLFKLNASTVGNILLKVNSKLNGVNHSLVSQLQPAILKVPCMIMGADVTHPSPDSRNIPSVAAVTASYDPKAFCYKISTRLQPPKVEIIADLERIVKDHLLFFYKKNNQRKPYSIIFFRDGVSEGQFDQVKITEIMAIRRACHSLEKDYEPKVTFLVVQKRHHTRLFPTNKRDSEDRNNNVPAGTCVDTTITHPSMQDFYLVSHASIQGVAKPTKYCTLWDENNMSNDDIEELTYSLCHLFTRCNRSVSYPAPTYYAHLAAARAKVYIENENLDLDNLQNEQKKIQLHQEIIDNNPMFFV